MKRYRIYNLVFLGSLPLSVLLIAWLSTYFEVKKFFLDNGWRKGQHEIIFLGDSVIRGYGRCDSSRLGINEYLENISGMKTLDASRASYSPLIHASAVRLLERAKRPEYVVIPVNLRSFSKGWYENPQYRFYARNAQIDLFLDPFSPVKMAAFLKYLLPYKVDQMSRDWNNEEISAGSFSGRRAELDRIFENAFRQKRFFECGDVAGAQQTEALKKRYAYNYDFELTDEHEVLMKLGETIDRLRSYGIKPVVYLTPVNVEDAEKYAGREVRQRISKNSAIIREWLLKRGVALEDLTGSLGESYFIDRFCACEHLDSRGRWFVAEKVAAMIKKLDRIH